MRILYAFRVRSSIFTSHESCNLPSGSVLTLGTCIVGNTGPIQINKTITSYVTQASRWPMTKKSFSIVRVWCLVTPPSNSTVSNTEQLSSPFVLFHLSVMLCEPGSTVKFPICPATTKWRVTNKNEWKSIMFQANNSKAVDCVNHDILISKLGTYGITGKDKNSIDCTLQVDIKDF